MALLNHQHEWGHTHSGMQCLNCSASVPSGAIKWPQLPPGDEYGSGTYGSGTYGHPNVSTPTTTLSDLTHIVDFIWYEASNVGSPIP